jgi:hypothetical protein
MSGRDQKIREMAYAIWEKEGRPAGRADRHWEVAEKAVETTEQAEVAITTSVVTETKEPLLDEELQATFDEAAGLDEP